MATQTLTIYRSGRRATSVHHHHFDSGVTLSPSSGITPANVTVSVDPMIYQSQKGTVAVTLTLDFDGRGQHAGPVRVLINSREPDQRGTFLNIPGKLVDLAADPVQGRYYVLRQDTNEVLVFNSLNNTQMASLRTYNSRSSMAFTMDGRYLLVGIRIRRHQRFRPGHAEPPRRRSRRRKQRAIRSSSAVTTRRVLATAEAGIGHILQHRPATARPPRNFPRWACTKTFCPWTPSSPPLQRLQGPGGRPRRNRVCV